MIAIVRRVVSRWTAVLVFEFCAFVYLLTIDRKQVYTDAYAASLESWRIAVGHTPWLEGLHLVRLSQLVGFGHAADWVHSNPQGLLVVYRSPGVIIASIPAYWLRGGPSSTSGYSTIPGSLTAAFLTAAAMALLFAALRRHVGTPVALVSTGVLAFATPMWSVSANWMFTHPVTVLGIAGMAWGADRDRWWLVGLFGGIGLWGRLHVVLVVTILGLGVACWRRDWRIALRVCIPSAVLLGLASLWSHWLYRSWFPSGGYGSAVVGSIARGNTTTAPVQHGIVGMLENQVGLWIAPDRGLLVWTPVVFVLLPALVRSWRMLPDWSRLLLIAGVAYALTQGQLDSFTGGDGFWGYRLMLETVACATPALVFAAKDMGRVARAVTPWACGVMLAAIGFGATDPQRVVDHVQSGPWLMRREVWRDNAYLHWLARGDSEAWAFLAVGAVVAVAWVVAAGVLRRRGAEVPATPLVSVPGE